MPARPDEPDAVPPELPEDDDAAWASLVARLGDLDPVDDEDDSPEAAGTPVEDRPADGPHVTYPVAPWVSDPHVVRPARRTGEPSGRDWDGTDQIDEAEAQVDASEHFVPPDPGPVLGGDPLLTMAWLAVTAPALLLLVVAVAWRSAPTAVLQAAGLVFVLGVAVLVWRMPHRRDPSDDDTGAVV
ncbi:hypothetical protein [Cellulomonas soli]|uniref:Uncharacterized protein n=1 Tax=Cellulomonas soli TaxID=931535 RepID=A0A512P9R7_9CELL|nr:hypothetical protein [Cellulomonas soli]NYI60434.1 hypothetical protein [Cellulomonas soli]GEP67948.1 hypothetical protein CSO01_06630 [Cellulomonas soli]